MTLLNKDSAKKIQRKHVVVNFPDYDIEIKLQALSIAQQLHIEENTKKDENAFVLDIIRFCCVDENANAIFDDNKDVEHLPAALTIKIFKECLKLNHLGEKDLDKLAKNS